jgi:hypothetical protein
MSKNVAEHSSAVMSYELSESGFTGLKDWQDKSSQGVAVGLGYGRLSAGVKNL